MAKKSSGRLKYLAIPCNLAALILVLLITLAGTNNTLTGLFYLKTELSDFKVASKLSQSSFLQDLSAVSGKDLVGNDATASSLGLAKTYTVNLLTSCSISETATTCSGPRLSFNFNPGSDLKFDSTALQGTYKPAYLSALDHYRKISPFLSSTFILSAVLILLATIFGTFGARRPLIVGATFSALAAALILTSTIVGWTTFRDLANAMRDNFGSTGLQVAIGRTPQHLGYAAFAFSFLSTVFLAVTAHYAARSKGAKGGSGGVAAGEPVMLSAKGKVRTFLGNMPTLGQHKYVQVEKQPAAALPRSSAAFDANAGEASPLDPDWTAEDEDPLLEQQLPATSTTSSGGGGSGKSQEVNTAYEPFKPSQYSDTAYQPYSGAS